MWKISLFYTCDMNYGIYGDILLVMWSQNGQNVFFFLPSWGKIKNKTDFIRPYDWILPHDFKLFYKSAIHLFMSKTEQKWTLMHSYVIRQLALPLKWPSFVGYCVMLTSSQIAIWHCFSKLKLSLTLLRYVVVINSSVSIWNTAPLKVFLHG